MGAVTNSQLPDKLKNDVHSHGFQFTLKLPKIKGWDDFENRKKILKKLGIDFYTSNSNKACRILQKNIISGRFHKVHLTRVSIINYWPTKESIFSDDPMKGLREAVRQFILMLEDLKKTLKLNSPGFQLNKRFQFTISRQHQGKLDALLAKHCLKNNNIIRLYNKKGCWFVCDNSLHIKEWEAVQAEDAVPDYRTVDNFLNDLQSNPTTLSEVREDVDIKFDSIIQGTNTNNQILRGIAGMMLGDKKTPNKRREAEKDYISDRLGKITW